SLRDVGRGKALFDFTQDRAIRKRNDQIYLSGPTIFGSRKNYFEEHVGFSPPLLATVNCTSQIVQCDSQTRSVEPLFRVVERLHVTGDVQLHANNALIRSRA